MQTHPKSSHGLIAAHDICARRCTHCQRIRIIGTPIEKVRLWKTAPRKIRPLIQKAFPDLPIDEREMIKTGICPTCWDKIFSEEETPEGFVAARRFEEDKRTQGLEPDDSQSEPRRPHHAHSGHSDGEGYDGEDR